MEALGKAFLLKMDVSILFPYNYSGSSHNCVLACTYSTSNKKTKYAKLREPRFVRFVIAWCSAQIYAVCYVCVNFRLQVLLYFWQSAHLRLL